MAAKKQAVPVAIKGKKDYNSNCKAQKSAMQVIEVEFHYPVYGEIASIHCGLRRALLNYYTPYLLQCTVGKKVKRVKAEIQAVYGKNSVHGFFAVLQVVTAGAGIAVKTGKANKLLTISKGS